MVQHGDAGEEEPSCLFLLNSLLSFSAVSATGAGAALAGVLRAGDCSDPVDPSPYRDLRGEEVPC